MMNDLLNLVRPALHFVTRRSMFLVGGAALGYALGYRDADAGEPSVYSRAQSLIGVDHVRVDHMRRERAVDAIRQARMDSLDALIPH
jgi:hypothetical protein